MAPENSVEGFFYNLTMLQFIVAPAAGLIVAIVAIIRKLRKRPISNYDAFKLFLVLLAAGSVLAMANLYLFGQP